MAGFYKAKILRFYTTIFDQVFDKSASYPFRLSKHTRKLQVTSDTKIKRKYKVFQNGMFFDSWNVFFGRQFLFLVVFFGGLSLIDSL